MAKHAGELDCTVRFALWGVEEIGLYVGIGLKEHQQTKDEMQRFMEEIAPHFEGPHNTLAAAAQ